MFTANYRERGGGGADRENEGSHTNKKLLSYKVLSIYLLWEYIYCVLTNCVPAVAAMSRVYSLCWWKSNSTNNRIYKISFILEGSIFYSVRSIKYTSFQTNHLIRYYSCKKATAGSTSLSKINKEKNSIPYTYSISLSLSWSLQGNWKKNTIKMNENYAQLDPMWITGFFDGEGCFYINISIKS